MTIAVRYVQLRRAVARAVAWRRVAANLSIDTFSEIEGPKVKYCLISKCDSEIRVPNYLQAYEPILYNDSLPMHNP